MQLLEKLQTIFANLRTDKAVYLDENTAWVFMFKDGSYGVGIPYEGSPVNESFSNVKYYNGVFTFDGERKDCLVLVSTLTHLRNEFALICSHFVDNDERQGILSDPFHWWENWQELIGNAVKSKKPYSLIAEMAAVKYLLKQGEAVRWKPSDFSTNDIQTTDKAYEVKSTTSKYSDTFTVNSQFQMRDPDFIMFIKTEKSQKGISIESLMHDLTKLGMGKSTLEIEMEAMGFPKGARSRTDLYTILEARIYHVDDRFPGKELNEFLKNYNDPNVGKITYEVSLKSIEYDLLSESDLE